MGYHRAGWTVVGVDEISQPEYPFEFHEGDMFKVGRRLLASGRFDAVHASPPCQRYTALTRGAGRQEDYPDLIEPTRKMLVKSGLPWVIENVLGAPITHHLVLCGEMFGLDVIRHRFFEMSAGYQNGLHHPPHRGKVARHSHGKLHKGPYVGVYGRGSSNETPVRAKAMGIDWMTDDRAVTEAIPPIYTEYIGMLLLNGKRRSSVVHHRPIPARRAGSRL